MASANWMKATNQKAGALKRHFDENYRIEGNHSNKEIDKSLSHNNYMLGCNSYDEALNSMKKRTKEVDALIPPKRIRKDRVTCCFIELPCPYEITKQEKSDLFFKSAYKIMEDFFGEQNVHGGFVHKDEVHEYVDKDKKNRVSLEHIHVLVSAYTDEKGINGKAFETKARLKKLNSELENMCFRTFGLHLNTGESPGRQSVEHLKEQTELNAELAKIENAIVEAKNDFLTWQEKATIEEIRLREAEEKKNDAENKLSNAKLKLNSVNSKYDAAAKDLKDILDKKSRASEIRRNPFDRETQSYHINMLEQTRNIGYEAYKYMVAANEAEQNAAAIMEEVKRKEKEISPMYKKALKAKEEADYLRQNIEKEINIRVNDKIDKIFDGTSTNREKRLEEFCKTIKFKDGTTVLDFFEEHENALRNKNKDISR